MSKKREKAEMKYKGVDEVIWTDAFVLLTFGHILRLNIPVQIP
jgi:hypothetical protein